jgi:hypothetical protein
MRQCGDCQLCCFIMPILEIGKKAGVRCSNQKFGTGCKVHGTQAQPRSCQAWSCWWLMNPAFDLPRPDRAGYVVDPTPDVAVLGDVHTGKRISALQIWADTRHPDAWRAALPWIKEVIGDQEIVAVIRFGSYKAITIVPPKLSNTGDWLEVESVMMKQVTAAAIQRKAFEEEIERATSIQGRGDQL